MYRSLAADTRTGRGVVAEIEDRRSRFRCHLRRVGSTEQARELVAWARREYPAARHHCGAFVVHVDGAQPRRGSSDDGEPAGTAGMPMLDVLAGAGREDVAAVVVRWFGGVKLGTGGLTRAYSGAVRAALDEAGRAGRLVTVSAAPAWVTELPAADAGRVEAALRGAGVTVLDVRYGARVRLRVAGGIDTLAPRLAALTSGGAEWEADGEVVTETPG